MIIKVFEANDRIITEFSKELKGHDIQYFRGHNGEYPLSLYSDADILAIRVNSNITKETIENLPNLKGIVCVSTGYDNIDITHAKKKNIPVCNVPLYGARTVAEYTWSLILNTMRKTHIAEEVLHRNEKVNNEHLEGFDVENKTLAVCGTGNIGKNVIKIAQGFDVNIVAFDQYPDKNFAKKYNFTYVKSFDDLLPKADILTFHLPLLPSTYHTLNKKNIKKLKKGVKIINTARGEIIDTFALVYGLDNNIVSMAALDVFEAETAFREESRGIKNENTYNENTRKLLALNRRLIDEERVLVTPHMAFNSYEANGRRIQVAIDNIKSVISGKPINNVVK